MIKRTDYKIRLRKFLDDQSKVPFKWGTADCGALAGGAIEAMTGENPHSIVAGKYSSLEESKTVLKQHGFKDHVDMVAKLLTKIPPAEAAMGDIAIVNTKDGPCLGVVTGAYIEARSPSVGHVAVPLTEAKRAYRI